MALPFVAILVLGAGPLEVAVLRGLEIGTGLIVGLVAGAWVDRLRRRPILIWTDLGRAVLLATIPVAFVAGVLTLWQLFLVTALAAILTTFFDAADNAYLPTWSNGSASSRRTPRSRQAGPPRIRRVRYQRVPDLGAHRADRDRPRRDQIRRVGRAAARDPDARTAAATGLGPGTGADRDRRGIRVVLEDPVLRAFAVAQMLHRVLWGVFGATFFLFAID